MIDHVSVPVKSLHDAGAFYDAVLGPLGLARVKELDGAIGYGSDARSAASFWLLARREPGAASAGYGLHVSFAAQTRAMVDAFHHAALANGGKDAGRPGERPEYTMPFYGAFVFDLDGYKIEAVCRR